MENYLEIFTNYVKENYDMENDLIKEKYNHTLRVYTLMIYLALKLKLSNEDIILSSQIGLFHDLGRFREIVRNKNSDKKFNNLTFDHGAYSNKILFNDNLISKFNVQENHLIIKKALYFHNKKDLIDTLDDKEELFCKMIKDMDKLDILYLRSFKRHLKLDNNFNSKVLDEYMNGKTIDIKDLKSDSDRVLFYLSFIKDLYFDESFEIAISQGYLDYILKIIDIENVNLFEKIINKLKERIDKNVREKVRSS